MSEITIDRSFVAKRNKMKKEILILACITLGLTTAISAKKSPAVAEKMPTELKQEVAKHIDYPSFAKNELIEGEVWMKVALNKDSKVEIVDLSATNQKLGKYVRTELKDVTIDNPSFKEGNVYFMKVKFDLL